MLVSLWVFLICKAAESGKDGFIYVNPNLAYTPQTLAVVFGEERGKVEWALGRFQELGMLQQVEGKLLLPNYTKYYPTEEERRQSAERVKLSRARKAAALALPEATTSPEAPDVVAKWGLVYEALKTTGKLPSLTHEHLAIVDRDHPKADLAANVAEIVAEVQGVAGPVSTVLPWLRKAVSRLEVRIIQRSGGGMAGERCALEGQTWEVPP